MQLLRSLQDICSFAPHSGSAGASASQLKSLRTSAL